MRNISMISFGSIETNYYKTRTNGVLIITGIDDMDNDCTTLYTNI